MNLNVENVHVHTSESNLTNILRLHHLLLLRIFDQPSCKGVDVTTKKRKMLARGVPNWSSRPPVQCCAPLRQQSLAENARKHRPHRDTQKWPMNMANKHSSKKQARVCTPPHNIMLGLRYNFYLLLYLLGHYGMECCKNTSLLAPCLRESCKEP